MSLHPRSEMLLPKGWGDQREGSVDRVVTGDAVGQFEELLEKRVFLLGVIGDFFPRL